MQFGHYNALCDVAPLPLCSLVDIPHLNGPICYARSIEINSLLIFQPATIVMQIVGILMTAVMIYHIRIKYTAVGRKEMVMFFYLYMLTLILEVVVMSGVIPAGSNLFPHFAAAYYASVSAAICCLMLNGFVGFQFAEDGTFWSLWTIRLISLAVSGLTYFLAIGTFLNVGLSRGNPVVLWIWMFMIQALALLIYAALQIILVVNTLSDLWPIGNIVLGLFMFLAGQLILHLYSSHICLSMGHYIDGMFFTVICTLLSVMMVYKYWDSITKEDLEYSVYGNQNIWEVKEIQPISAPESIASLNQKSSKMVSQYFSASAKSFQTGLITQPTHSASNHQQVTTLGNNVN